ncbi:DNA polymerase [Enterobacter huaxiensis]|uniref:DNA polymerase n=1 Tax=Enterobacter huaxiensis TaxID=2494702 RepID=UPI002175AF7A|nr:DNA polymerase [Enterobacter huaxiensis]MCS5452529.1 DNA polymerase [Enterobacter huaxiensis]
MFSTKLFCDLETFSPTPINAGTHRYAESAEVLLFAYAFNDEPVDVWDVTAGGYMPPRLARGLLDKEVTQVWQNGGNFDRVVLWHALGIMIPMERMHDTMIQAYQHSLPGSLGQLCEIFRIPTDKAKDKDGKRLIQMFCKPRPKSSKVRRFTRETHPEDWAKFISYAGSDIEAMRAIFKKMPRWNCSRDEHAIWTLDQIINWRGVTCDMELARSALAAVDREQYRLALRAQELTGGEVESATKRDKLLRYISESFGVTLPDLTASTLERRLNDPELPAALRELLGVRLAATTASTAKYKKLLACVSSDGRLRGTIQYCGATRSGRFAGRLVQLQNLPRPTIKQEAVEAAIEAMKGGYADLVIPDVMQAASSALRGFIISPEGQKLYITDLSNIEGRVLAWMGGEEWKLEAFRDADAGRGEDLYKVSYGKAFDVDAATVDKEQRSVGKVLELSMGYQGSALAFLSFSLIYGLDPDELAARARPTIPDKIWEGSAKLYDWMTKNKLSTGGLSKDTWTALDALKTLWRLAHPGIVQLWSDVAAAAKAVITEAENEVTINGLVFDKKGSWLRIKLPSGRYLSYPAARVVDGSISYMGVNGYTRQWERIKTFGGKLVENIIQAIARDILCYNLALIEAAGYKIVMTVHDEVITEAPDTPEFSVDELSKLLANNPPWAADLPLNAAGFEAYRYRKD